MKWCNWDHLYIWCTPEKWSSFGLLITYLPFLFCLLTSLSQVFIPLSPLSACRIILFFVKHSSILKKRQYFLDTYCGGLRLSIMLCCFFPREKSSSDRPLARFRLRCRYPEFSPESRVLTDAHSDWDDESQDPPTPSAETMSEEIELTSIDKFLPVE